MKNIKIVFKKLNNLKGGVSMDAVLKVLREFDRLQDNEDFPTLEFVEKSLAEYGYLNLVIFVCPKMRGKYLSSDQRELFMPTEEPKDGLFFPRVPKLQQLTTKLWELGIPSKLTIIVGDNSYEVFKAPVLGNELNKEIMNERRKAYVSSLNQQLSKMFPQLMEICSLGLMGSGTYQGKMEIPQDMLLREAEFQRESLQKYYGIAEPKDSDLLKIAELMLRAYAEEGYLIEATEGILLATEGTEQTESWVRRIQMFKLGDAKFPCIYPYIRKES